MGDLGHGFPVDPGLNTASSDGRGTFAFKTEADSCFNLLQFSHVGPEPRSEARSGASIAHCYEILMVGYVGDSTSKSCCRWFVVRVAGFVPSATHLGRAQTFQRELGSPVSDTTEEV